MRKFLVLTFVALFAMVGVVSAADTAQTSAALKIGVVDMQTLAQDSDPAKAGRAELEKKYGKERKDLEDEGEKLRKRAEKLKDDQLVKHAAVVSGFEVVPVLGPSAIYDEEEILADEAVNGNMESADGTERLNPEGMVDLDDGF